MTRRAISVTLESDNVTWLKGRAGAEGESVSELIDQLVTSARSCKRAGPARSVIGTIDIHDSDPLLDRADAAMRAAFAASLGRPRVVRERPAAHRTNTRKPRTRG
jgi:hypothetical protein